MSCSIRLVGVTRKRVGHDERGSIRKLLRAKTPKRSGEIAGGLLPVLTDRLPESGSHVNFRRPKRERTRGAFAAMLTGKLAGRRRSDQQPRMTGLRERREQRFIIELGGREDDDGVRHFVIQGGRYLLAEMADLRHDCRDDQ